MVFSFTRNHNFKKKLISIFLEKMNRSIYEQWMENLTQLTKKD